MPWCHLNFLREVICGVWYLKAIIEALGFGLDLSGIFQNSFIQNQSFTPFLHQNIGLSYIETPVQSAMTQALKNYSNKEKKYLNDRSCMQVHIGPVSGIKIFWNIVNLLCTWIKNWTLVIGPPKIHFNTRWKHGHTCKQSCRFKSMEVALNSPVSLVDQSLECHFFLEGVIFL